jgi:hypothetical protein
MGRSRSRQTGREPSDERVRKGKSPKASPPSGKKQRVRAEGDVATATKKKGRKTKNSEREVPNVDIEQEAPAEKYTKVPEVPTLPKRKQRSKSMAPPRKRESNDYAKAQALLEEIQKEKIKDTSGAMGDMSLLVPAQVMQPPPPLTPHQLNMLQVAESLHGAMVNGRQRLQAPAIYQEIKKLYQMDSEAFNQYIQMNPEFENAIASHEQKLREREQRIQGAMSEMRNEVAVAQGQPASDRPNIGVPSGSTVYTGVDVPPSESNLALPAGMRMVSNVTNEPVAMGEIAQDLQMGEEPDEQAAQQEQAAALGSAPEAVFTDIGVSTSAQGIAAVAAPPRPARGAAAISRPFLNASKAALDAAFMGLQQNSATANQAKTGLGDVGAPGPRQKVVGAMAIGNQHIMGEHRTHNMAAARMLMRKFHVMI